MLDRPEFTRWRRSAEEALEGARAQVGAGLHHWACFLAEQSAQLSLKALLHGVGRAPWGHDLVALGRAAAEALGGPLGSEAEAALRRLSRHYIPARYPDAVPSGSPGEHYGAEDSQEAIADARAVAAVVDEAWRRLGAASGD
jgi:HEPN domain-containing protein